MTHAGVSLDPEECKIGRMELRTEKGRGGGRGGGIWGNEPMATLRQTRK